MDEQPVETTLYSLSDRAPDPVERRDDERYLTLFRVGTVMINDRRELCLIKNISSGGMMIRPYCKLAVGDKVSVELKRGEQIPGLINWVRQDSAGIEFNERIDVIELLATSMEGPRPRMPRVEVRCIASVRQGANVYGMRAHDVSQGGVKVESDRDLEIGAHSHRELAQPRRGDTRRQPSVAQLPELPEPRPRVFWYFGCRRQGH